MNYSAEQLRKLEQLADDLEAMAKIRKYRKIDFFAPYPKQAEHIANGAKFRERMLMAGNQQGKTECGAAETAMHLTGEYPDDWKGHRFNHPVKWWACAPTGTLVRDGAQKKLCGEAGVEDDFGAGYIPRERFIGRPTLARGVSDAYDTVQVEHRTNGVVDGISILRFKSYEQGRVKFQSETLDGIWLDEEPPIDIYQECLARISATKGIVYLTFTGLKGMTDVVDRYLNQVSPDRTFVRMTIEDALHIPLEERQKIIDGYAPHERDARVRGLPMLGSGKIFVTPIETVSEPPITDVPSYWCKIWGIDFGIDHPFAAALLYWDRDNDIIHVAHTLRMSDATIMQHASAMKTVANLPPVAWPQDGTQRDRGSLVPFSKLYKDQGLAMLTEHATFPDGSLSTEAGVAEMNERMGSGRLKVASHLSEFWEEYGLYHRDKGLIVKIKDDVLSAVRVGIMMRRFAKAVPLGSGVKRRRNATYATGVDDWDVFTGAPLTPQMV